MNMRRSKSLLLVVLCSLVVSLFQLFLHRSIVFNTRNTPGKRRESWRLNTHEESDIKNTSKQYVKNPIIFNEIKQTPRVKVVPGAKIEEQSGVKVDGLPAIKAKIDALPAVKVKIDDLPGDKVKIEDSLRTCSSHVPMSGYHQFAQITSNFSDWSFSKKRVCPVFKIKESESKTRLKFVVSCGNGEAFAKLISTNLSGDIQQFLPNDNCLRRFVEKCCSDSLPVPNVVHYVLYNKRELTFIDFVSFISVLRFVRPCVILIHGNIIPSGNYWNFILKLYPNIVHVFREVRQTLFGQKVKFIEHFGDVWRIKALLRFGGIYLDTDTLLVKPIEPLRRFPCTMSRQSNNVTQTLVSAFIMAERNVTFVRAWYDWYKIYYVNSSYAYNAMMYPSLLAGRKPGLIHIEHGTVARPDNQFRDIIFNTNTNWANIYGMHLYVKSYRGNTKYIDENSVKTFNATVGAICRHILYGNKDLCFSSS